MFRFSAGVRCHSQPRLSEHATEFFATGTTIRQRDSTRKLEFQWHEELEKRFSFWPVLTGSSMLWAIIMAMLLVAWVRRRKKARETLARWAKEEAEEDARRAAIVEAAPETPFSPSVVRVSIPTIQHEGEWHVLH